MKPECPDCKSISGNGSGAWGYCSTCDPKHSKNYRRPEAEKTRLVTAMREAVRQTRADQADVIAMMPNRATTAGQRALQRKSGTPRQFARAVVNAIGEISVQEAHATIRKYLEEWKAA